MKCTQHSGERCLLQVDEGLVDKSSEFCGTKRLGLVYVDTAGRLAEVGCVLEIEKHKQLNDGRMLVRLQTLDPRTAVWITCC